MDKDTIWTMINSINVYRMEENGSYDDDIDCGLIITKNDITAKDIQRVISLANDISSIISTGDDTPEFLYQEYEKKNLENINLQKLKPFIQECCQEELCYSELIVKCLEFVYPGQALWIDGIISGTVYW